VKYRKFDKIDNEVSLFGFGCMRFPLKSSDVIDEDQAIKMIRHAIDNGVNYIDTAHPYHGGKSEVILGRALKDGYREKTMVTTKLPSWEIKSEKDFERLLTLQLKRLDLPSVDTYLLHALDKNYWKMYQKLNVFKFLEEKKREGKFKYIGFSFHDDVDLFKKIIDSYDWDICQIQLNILDNDYQAGEEGLRYAGKKGVPVVIMEPLKGGTLARNVPKSAAELYDDYPKKFPPHEWAFRWVANHPEVITILSGVSSFEQTVDNLRIFSEIEPLEQEDLKLIDAVRNVYAGKTKVGCTACRYCMPCPNGVFIPETFTAYNRAAMLDFEDGKRRYAELVGKNAGASSCVECGACEKACPQAIKIIDKLREADAFLK
jgi:predicted aldo/keto reductase-like oxidoreductase